MNSIFDGMTSLCIELRTKGCRFAFAGAITIAAILFSAPNHSYAADEEALTFDAIGAGFNYYQGTYSLGWRFKALGALRVTALGFYDDLRNGLAASHEVGIYEVDTCNLVASAVVSPSDPLEGTGFFRYKAITPVTLESGRDYYVAAVTNDGDRYAVNVSTMTPNSLVDYWGFAIYGNTQSSSILRCPNGSAGQQGFKGDYGPNFKFGDSTGGGDPTPTPTPTASNGKKASKITLFCNRKGVLLEQASCTATVADNGSSPRITPTGTIDFVSTNGFTPATSSCFPVKPDLSPDGIAACGAEFQIPNGFPIGAKFPIDATYSGDAIFNPSSTSHTLIQAGCIGTPDNPCSGAVAMSFSNNGLQVLKAALQAVIGCGTTAGLQVPPSIEPGIEGAGIFVGCGISLNLESSLAETLSSLGLTKDMCASLAAQISAADARSDDVLKALKDVYQKAGSNESYFNQINVSPEALNGEILKYIRRAQQQDKRSSLMVKPRGYSIQAARKMKFVTLGKASSKVKANTEKTVKLRLNNFGKRFTKALKGVGIRSTNLKFTLKSTRLGPVPDGVSKKVSASESMDVTF